jgi:Xaa-Pro aminopeptidase
LGEGINFEWSLRKEFNMYNKWGQFGKDFEEGVNFERLRRERLQKTREAMKRHGLGAIVALKLSNSRYITGTRGLLMESAMHRYAVLPIEGDPVLFELGGDLGRLKEGAPWLGENLTFSIPVFHTPHLGGASELKVRTKLKEMWVDGIKEVLKKNGVANERVGFDQFDLEMIEPLEKANIKYVNGEATMLDARSVKTQDELQLLSIASTIAEAGFHKIAEVIKPGIRECEVWGELARTVHALGAERLEGICTSGGRTNPYYRLEGTDKILRPGDFLIVDIVLSYLGYHTCVVRTFLVGDKPTKEQKDLYRACYDALYRTINTCKAGVMTDKVAEALPKGNWSNFSLNIAHGLGIYTHEAPFILESYSKGCPLELKPNMYIAIETYEGEPGGSCGVRLEENLVVTEKGYEIFSKYPFDERML